MNYFSNPKIQQMYGIITETANSWFNKINVLFAELLKAIF